MEKLNELLSSLALVKEEDMSLKLWINILDLKQEILDLLEEAEDTVFIATKKGVNTGYEIQVKVTGNRTINDEDQVVEWFLKKGISIDYLYEKKIKGIEKLRKLSSLTQKEFDETFKNSIYAKKTTKEILIKRQKEENENE